MDFSCESVYNIDGDKMKKLKSILCFFLCTSILSGCTSSEATLKKYSMTATNLGFDTVISFTAYAENEATYKKWETIVREEFKRYDKLFDKYNAYKDIANIKTINENAGKKKVIVDPSLIELLTIAKSYDALTSHKFDITMGAVFDIWHDYREAGLLANENKKEAKIPSMKELKNANKFTGWKNVIINEKESSVYINNTTTQLDVGGVAKGFAVEKIAQKLEEAGCQHAIVNGGGNIRLIGNKPQSDSWSVGIQIPNLKEQQSDSLVSVKIDTSKSLVTSGDYQRFYMYKDQIMHHIIDPSTLLPARHSRSVTVVCEDSTIADILSTTLYTLSHQEGELLLKELKERFGIEVGAIWVYDDIQNVEDKANVIETKGYHIVVSDNLKDKIS